MPPRWPGRRRPSSGPRPRRCRGLGAPASSPGGLAGPVMGRVGDSDMGGQHPIVAGHHLAAQGDDELGVVDTHMDPPADRFGVHRVVVGVMADPVIGGQTQVVMPVHIGQHRRQGHHGGQVLVDALRRPAAKARMDPHVGLALQPVAQLGVEVVAVGEVRPGMKLVSKYPLVRSTTPLRSGWPLANTIDPMPSVPFSRR